jgi:hypothetical protein
MARQTGIKLRCTVDDIIYYELNGGYYMRSKPMSNKQTKATKQAASFFGLAQTAAGNIRSALSGVLVSHTIFDKKNDLAQPINQWMLTGALSNSSKQNDLAFISGYEFNSKSALATRWKIKCSVERNTGNTLLLNIPAYNATQKMQAPAGTKGVDIFISACSCNIKSKQLTGMYSKQQTIAYSNSNIPAQQLPLPVLTAKGNLTIVFITLRYTVIKNGKQQIVQEQAWVPGAVVAALYN